MDSVLAGLSLSLSLILREYFTFLFDSLSTALISPQSQSIEWLIVICFMTRRSPSLSYALLLAKPLHGYDHVSPTGKRTL